MSRLKCAGVGIAVIGAVWVEFFSANHMVGDDGGTLAEEEVANGGPGMGDVRWLSTGDGTGRREGDWGGGAFIGSLILFWQVSMYAKVGYDSVCLGGGLS